MKRNLQTFFSLHHYKDISLDRDKEIHQDRVNF